MCPSDASSVTSKRVADEDAPGDRKRQRRALSCSQCKRRKIKCDRLVSQPFQGLFERLLKLTVPLHASSRYLVKLASNEAIQTRAIGTTLNLILRHNHLLWLQIYRASFIDWLRSRRFFKLYRQIYLSMLLSQDLQICSYLRRTVQNLG